MGKDITVHILKNCIDKWEELILYTKDKKGKYVPVSPYDGRDYELFDYLSGNQDEEIPIYPLQPSLLPDELKKEYEQNKDYCFDFYEINLADLKLYLLQHPTVPDYDADTSGVTKNNPVSDFLNNIIHYIEILDWITDTPSYYKIIFWFDH